MRINKILIEEDKKITVDLPADGQITVIKENNELIFDVICAVVGKECSKKEYSKAVRFFCEVEMDCKIFVYGQKQKGEWNIVAKKAGFDEDFTDGYFALLTTSKEQNKISEFSNFIKQDYPHRLCQYKDIEKYSTKKEFGDLTDGVGLTRSFRACMNDYIKNFEPIKLCKDKDYIISLLPNGEFVVTDSNYSKKVELNEIEKTQYHLLCCLLINEFWQNIERFKNMNSFDHPVTIKDISNQVDIWCVFKAIELSNQIFVFLER